MDKRGDRSRVPRRGDASSRLGSSRARETLKLLLEKEGSLEMVESSADATAVI